MDLCQAFKISNCTKQRVRFVSAIALATFIIIFFHVYITEYGVQTVSFLNDQIISPD